MLKDELKINHENPSVIAEMNEKINNLQEKIEKKEADEKTDLLAKDLNKPQQVVLVIFFVAFLFGYGCLILEHANSIDTFSMKVAGALYTILITACFIILDFCPISSKRKRIYTVTLRVFTCVSVLLGVFYFT